MRGAGILSTQERRGEILAESASLSCSAREKVSHLMLRAPLTPVETVPIIARPTVRSTGAVSHSEAIFHRSDHALQRLIDEAEKKYKKWPTADLLALQCSDLTRYSRIAIPSYHPSPSQPWRTGLQPETFSKVQGRIISGWVTVLILPIRRMRWDIRALPQKKS
jgi:hypothetical protein